MIINDNLQGSGEKSGQPDGRPTKNDIVILPISSANIPRKLIDISLRKKKVSKFAKSSSHYQHSNYNRSIPEGETNKNDLYCDDFEENLRGKDVIDKVKIIQEKGYGGYVDNEHYDELEMTNEEYMATSQYLDNGFEDNEVIVTMKLFIRYLTLEI